ncbi:MAG TPA: Gfo/Idh/MocA family oxidoreductase [Gemmatales bacterium]|nr:Gfo/Idh/MocA family oxidoreductase [Gemmatales bacterium]
MLGVGIIGCGMIARFHAAALAEIPQTKLVALQSRNPAGAETVKQAVGSDARYYASIEEVLQHPGLDMVIICTPSGNHLEPARLAAVAGKHVVVEKPLEITLDRCDQLIEVCAKAGVKLCTIFPSRFADANVVLKQAVDQGRFGKLTLGETTVKWWRSQEYYDECGWKGTQALDGGGALMNQAIHNVDLLQWLMGPVVRISAFTAMLAHEKIEVEDTAVACLQFRNGALGVIQATTSVWPGLPKTIGIHGNQGSAVVEQEDLLRWEFVKEQETDTAIRQRFAQKVGTSGGSSNPAAISHEYHRRQLADFVEAIETGRQPVVDGKEGRKAVEIILGIYESARTGRAVELRL